MTDFLKSLDISGSGLTMQKHRLDIISQNIANAETTRTESGGPYRRKVPYIQGQDNKDVRFKEVLEAAKNGHISARAQAQLAAARRGETYSKATEFMDEDLRGVKVGAILEDQTDFVPVYDPDHPDADENGYVMYPNVDVTQEIIDAMDASRTYEANITAYNAVKEMLQRAMDMKI